MEVLKLSIELKNITYHYALILIAKLLDANGFFIFFYIFII